MEGIKGILLTAWGNIQDGYSFLAGELTDILPGIILAIIVLVVGSVVAMFLGELVSSVIKKGKIDQPIETVLSPVAKLLNCKINSSKLIGETVKWFLLAVFLIAAFNLASLTSVVDFFGRAIAFLKSVFIGVLILVVGSLIARLAVSVVSVITKGNNNLETLAGFSVNLFASIIALTVILHPIVNALSYFVAKLPVSQLKSDALFIGIVVLLVLAFKDTTTKFVDKLLKGL